jgi:AcrR family transcriptional regulator
MPATVLHLLGDSARMHSMRESATSLREQKRWDTSHRITACALRLTLDRGLDGFTMDDLAESAEVSRRTLFNYFPGKVDAVLGAVPDLPPAALATFHTGGPHGKLLDDLGELAKALVGVKEPDRETLRLSHQVLTTNPRLLVAVHERFEQITEQFVVLITDREGADFRPRRAQLALRILVGIFDSALMAFREDDGDRTIGDHFDEQMREARSLFG